VLFQVKTPQVKAKATVVHQSLIFLKEEITRVELEAQPLLEVETKVMTDQHSLNLEKIDFHTENKLLSQIS